MGVAPDRAALYKDRMRRKRPLHERAAMAGIIRAWRIHRKLKQDELGEKCGWSSGTQISKYETGSQWPDDPSLERIARALGVDAKLLEAQARELAEVIARRGGTGEGWTGDYPTGEELGGQPGWIGEGHLPEDLLLRRRELLAERRDLDERWLLLEDELRVASVRIALAEEAG